MKGAFGMGMRTGSFRCLVAFYNEFVGGLGVLRLWGQ